MKGKVESYMTITKPKSFNERPQYHYTVTKTSKYGTFTSTVGICDADFTSDEEISHILGYQYAERKCDIKIIHAKARMLYERAEGIRHLLNVFSGPDAIHKYSPEVLKDIERQYKIAKGIYEKTYAQYKYMINDFSNYTDRCNALRLKSIQRKEEIEKRNS